MSIRPPSGGGGSSGDADVHGEELGYAERTTNDTTTNTSLVDADLAANTIGGLTFTVTGDGNPVDVEFRCSGAYHSTANTRVNAVLLVNGSSVNGDLGAADSPSTSGGPSLSFKRRLVLTDGVSYTFEVAKRVAAAGTGTYVAAATFPMYLAATRR